MHQSGPVIIAQRPCTKDWRWPSTLWTRRISTLLARISLSLSTFVMYYQGRNHVFKVGGPVPWSRVLLSFYRKKLYGSTQFGAVGYIITLFIKKLHENLGVRTPLDPQWLRQCVLPYMHLCETAFIHASTLAYMNEIYMDRIQPGPQHWWPVCQSLLWLKQFYPGMLFILENVIKIVQHNRKVHAPWFIVVLCVVTPLEHEMAEHYEWNSPTKHFFLFKTVSRDIEQ